MIRREGELKILEAISRQPRLFVFSLVLGIVVGVALTYMFFKVARGLDIYEELFVRSRRRTIEDE